MKRSMILAALAALAAGTASAQVEGFASIGDVPETLVTNLPFTITKPGFYYLNNDLHLSTPGVDGIRVQADRVGIDCLGFSITGPGDDSGNGISQDPTNRYFMIANGSMSGWKGKGSYAIHAPGGANRIQNMKVFDNGKGILVGDSSSVSSCSVASNTAAKTGYGIYAYAGSEVLDCDVREIRGAVQAFGIRVDANSAVRGSTVASIAAGGTSVGIFAGARSRIEDCEATAVQGINERSAGIKAEAVSVVRECVASGNTGHGVWIEESSRAEENTCENNAGVGIVLDGGISRIENNIVRKNAYGIRATGAGNTITGNRVEGNVKDMVITDPSRPAVEPAPSQPGTAPNGKKGPTLEIEL